MKRLTTVIALFISMATFGQADKVKTLEQRARDFHQAIAVNDKTVWRKYMLGNFTQALIERPMRAKVVTTENDNTSSSSTTSSTNTQIKAKLAMFEQLHRDFGKGKITNVKTQGDLVEMTIHTETGLTGVFRLDAEPKSPWLIDRMAIEVEANN